MKARMTSRSHLANHSAEEEPGELGDDEKGRSEGVEPHWLGFV